MKKLLLTIIIIFTSLVSIAQEVLQSYALEVGHWDSYYQEYNWERIKVCDVRFILQGDVIIANDEAESTYYTYETIIATDASASWNAFDEQKRKCIVSLVNGDESVFIVIYNDICYRYYVNI